LNKRTVSTFEGSKNGNNKYLLYRHQLQRGLPVFETLLAPSIACERWAIQRQWLRPRSVLPAAG
jgi:hypothetical protein